MSFNSSSRSNSKHGSRSHSSGSNHVQKINSVNDLENIIKNAKSNGLKKVTVKDYQESFLKVGLTDLFGNRVDISPFPSLEKTFIIEFV